MVKGTGSYYRSLRPSLLSGSFSYLMEHLASQAVCLCPLQCGGEGKSLAKTCVNQSLLASVAVSVDVLLVSYVAVTHMPF